MGDDPTKLLATIQVAITLMGSLASATAAITLATPLTAWLAEMGIPFVSTAASGFAIALVTLAISYVTLVIGELVPKRLGLQRSEAVAVFAAIPIKLLAQILTPVIWLLTKSTVLVASLLGVKDDGNANALTEEELKLLVTEQGQLLDEEKRMIHSIFDLDDTIAKEIMVPRVDILFIEDDKSVAEAAGLMQTRGYSRAPVFHENTDSIVGVLFVKDLLIPLTNAKDDELITNYMRSAMFVPESKNVLELLEEMQAQRNQMAIVVDEYGGTAGIVTMEDIVEEVVGEIFDEYDRSKDAVKELRPQVWVVDGATPIEDAIEQGFDIEDSDAYETIAGWMLDQFGHIPHVGEELRHNDYVFSVQSMRRRRIARIRIDGSARSGDGSEDA